MNGKKTQSNEGTLHFSSIVMNKSFYFLKKQIRFALVLLLLLGVKSTKVTASAPSLSSVVEKSTPYILGAGITYSGLCWQGEEQGQGYKATIFW